MQLEPSPSRAEASVASLNRRQLLARHTFFPAAAQVTARLKKVLRQPLEPKGRAPTTDAQRWAARGAQASCRAPTMATPSSAPSSQNAAETPAAPASTPAAAGVPTSPTRL